MPTAPEKQQSDSRPLAAFAAPTFSMPAFSMEGWPEEALKREAALIAAYPTSRAQFIALLAAIRG